MQLSSVLLCRGYSLANSFEDKYLVSEQVDSLADRLYDAGLCSMPSSGNDGAGGTSGSAAEDRAPDWVKSIQDPETLTDQVIAYAAKAPRSRAAHDLEVMLMSKLGKPEAIFSREEVFRLMTVIASLPSSADKLLQEIRTAMLSHPGLAEFRSLYSVPNWKTVQADGTLSKNNCSRSSRHVRMRRAVILALSKIYVTWKEAP